MQIKSSAWHDLYPVSVIVGTMPPHQEFSIVDFGAKALSKFLLIVLTSSPVNTKHNNSLVMFRMNVAQLCQLDWEMPPINSQAQL